MSEKSNGKKSAGGTTLDLMSEEETPRSKSRASRLPLSSLHPEETGSALFGGDEVDTDARSIPLMSPWAIIPRPRRSPSGTMPRQTRSPKTIPLKIPSWPGCWPMSLRRLPAPCVRPVKICMPLWRI